MIRVLLDGASTAAGAIGLAIAPMVLVLVVAMPLLLRQRPMIRVDTLIVVIQPWDRSGFDGGIIIGARCYSPRQAFGEDI